MTNEEVQINSSTIVLEISRHYQLFKLQPNKQILVNLHAATNLLNEM